MRFVLIDCNNLAHRMKHIVKHYNTFDECVGLILQNIFSSLRKSYERFGAEHVVACFDSYSWRKNIYPEYKADRHDEDAHLSPSKIEEDEILHEVLNELRIFLEEFTNVTVLGAPGVEADDFIARWVTIHEDPAFHHTIISADTDFIQLIRDNVHLYDPLYHRLFLPDGVYFQDGKPIKRSDEIIEYCGERWKVKYDKKTAERVLVEPEWSLYEKCIRGGKNNLKSAYPWVQTKRLRKAFADRGGVEWNNILNHIWGPEEARQSVRERYEFNRKLLDLKRQPQAIKDQMDEEILQAISKPPARMVGAYFAKFAGKYDLRRVLNYPDAIVQILSRPYDD